MFKKVFLSPFFTPVVFFCGWFLVMGEIYFCCPQNILLLTQDGEWIDVVSKLGYLLLIGVLFCFSQDFKDKICAWGLYLFFALICFLRESGIQHFLSKTDTTPFKSRFFLNPKNPFSEKLLYGLILIFIFAGLLYLGIKYSRYLIASFFKFNAVTWSVAVLCMVLVCAKFVDRFPSKYRKMHGGVRLSDDVYALFQLVEETSEMFLPYLAILALWQYHLICKKA